MNEIAENGIRIYTGEMDEDDDGSDIRDLRVSDWRNQQTTMTPLFLSLGVCSLLYCGQQHSARGERQEGPWSIIPLGRGGGREQGSL